MIMKEDGTVRAEEPVSSLCLKCCKCLRKTVDNEKKNRQKRDGGS